MELDEATAKKFKQLADLLDKRDDGYEQATKEIFEFVAPTVLAALYDLFGAPYENVTWLEIQLVESVLLIVASIAYDDSQPIPEIIEQLSPQAPMGMKTTTRLFRVGLPLNLVFTTKEQVLGYMSSRAKASLEKRKAATNPQPAEVKKAEDASVPVHDVEFDKTKLTAEQIQQIVMFQGQTKGVKH